MPVLFTARAIAAPAPPLLINFPVGINLNALSYFSPQQPFLNVMKQAGSNSSLSPWFTSKSSSLDTHEQTYLQVDSDGYLKSLTASPIPAGGQQFTFVQTYINFNLNGGTPPPGATQLYPSDTYRFQWQGKGTISFVGDVKSLTNPSAGCTISGTQVTSTNAWGTVNTVTLCGAAGAAISPAASGIQVQITSIPDSSNYPKDFSIVQSIYVSQYDAGKIFHPLFKASLAGYSRLRFMDWRCTNTHDWQVTFTANLALGATSGTLSSIATGGASFTTWPLASGTYQFVFQTGQVIAITCTAGSANLTWSTPLSAAISTTAIGGMAYWALEGSWSARSAYTHVSWTTVFGVPYEVCMALCNELGMDGWLNVPSSSHAVSSSYATSLAQLAFNGAGTTLPGFTGLNSGQKVYIEFSNETWNGQFKQNKLTQMLGYPLYSATQNQFYAGEEWKGVQTALIGDAFYSVYGSSAFGQRVVIVMAGQFATGNGTGFMNVAMNTPDWSSAAYTHHIGAISFAPYWGTNAISAADATTIVALADPLTTMFNLAYTNTYGGNTYSSLPANGYLGKTLTIISSLVSSFGGQPWAALPVHCYEGGSDFLTSGTPASGVSGWLAVLNNLHRDTRMQYLYYDPSHLFSSNLGYLPALVTSGFTTVNQYDDCFPISQFGEWGVLESVMQTLTPLSNAPPKFQGVQKYILGL